MHMHNLKLSASSTSHTNLPLGRAESIRVAAAGRQRPRQLQQQQRQQQQAHTRVEAAQQHVENATQLQQPYAQRVAVAEPSRRGSVLLLAAAASASAWLAPLPGFGFGPASASVPSSRAGDNVGFLTDSQVDKKRKKANFKRSHDGHVALLNRFSKQWTDVKCDLQVPGLLLLREASGQVFYLGYAGLKQVDLSDDQVVAAVAADDWENNITLVQAETAAGGIEALEMTREEFYSLVSLVSSEDWTAASSSSSKAPGTTAAAGANAAAAAGKAR